MYVTTHVFHRDCGSQTQSPREEGVQDAYRGEETPRERGLTDLKIASHFAKK